MAETRSRSATSSPKHSAIPLRPAPSLSDSAIDTQSTHQTETLHSNIPLEVDFENTESDSAYGDEISLFSASITSSVVDYQEEHGRRYHAYRRGRYLLPNDDVENERLDIHHELMLVVLNGKLHLAPILENIQKAIDLGTGTGIWAIDFADQYPSAEVVGNDLSPIQPPFIPPNLQFYVDDIEDEWGYEDTPLDYIHARFLVGAILDWPKLIHQAFKCTKPGGWVEFQDWDTNFYSPDGSLNPNHSIYQFHKTTSEAQEDKGYNMRPGPHLEQWLIDAGFTNVQCPKFILPLGTWPKDKHYKQIGAYNFLQMQQGLEGIALATLTRSGEWTLEEVQVLVAKARQDLRNPRIHGQYDFYVAYGQKPGV